MLHNSQAASLRGMVWVKNPPIAATAVLPQLAHTAADSANDDIAPESNVNSSAANAAAIINVHNSSSTVKNSAIHVSSSTGWSLQGTSGMTKDDAAAADTVARAVLLQASLMSGGGAQSALDKRWRAMTGSSLLQPSKPLQ
jgi:hypothetical protein